MYLSSVLFILFGYLMGSIPTAYLAGRAMKGIDLRQYGSGTVSGSMVWEHVEHWVIIPVGLFDVAKAAFPTWLAVVSGLGPRTVILTGLSAVVGHNWPIFLRFTGGRGLSPMLGMLLVLFPPGVIWLLVFLAIGRLYEPPLLALLGLSTIPLLSQWTGGPDYIPAVALAMLILTLTKRLEANRRPLPERGADRRQVLLRRLFLDRDIANHLEWIRRTPNQF